MDIDFVMPHVDISIMDIQIYGIAENSRKKLFRAVSENQLIFSAAGHS